MIYISLLLLLPVYTSAVTTGITDCESYDEEYNEKVTVDILGCPTASKDQPCEVKRKNRINGTLSWLAETSTSRISFMAETLVGDTYLTLAVEQDDICTVLKPYNNCQLEANKKYTINPTLYVAENSPLGKRPVKFSLYDNQYEMIFCVRGFVKVSK
ncbi:Uncharacterised protein g8755 [Pycnogonum litorale]